MNAPLRIQPSSPRRQAAALEFLFRAMSPGERAAQMSTTLAALRAGRLTAEGLWVAFRGERLVGVVWASPSGGKGALVWPPQIAAGESESTAVALLKAAEDWMKTIGIQIANAFVSDDQSADAHRFATAGYERAAEILYLVSQKESFPDFPSDANIAYIPFEQRDEQRMVSLIDATYQQTLDCPRLNGVQATVDVLAGYRRSGVFRPELWMFVRRGPTDVGCLLLGDHPEDNQYELVYQGVVPQARGEGLGLQMTRHAQWLAGRGGRERLVLAVDASNGPALRIYREAGFHQWDRRFLLLKVVPP